ncbi:MAG: Maf family protein [Spirosomaceae bacterium]|nr:Maf family protein [Spirosomataceae bacterium]
MLKTEYPIFLASKSPRRSEILRNAGFEFQLLDQNFDENIPLNMTPETIPLFLSNAKLHSLAVNVANKIVICADTVVILSNGSIGKPQDVDEAVLMLNQLSNSTHRVLTGVSIGTPKGFVEFVDTTIVTFKKLDKWEIDFYIENYKPFDKAGSYGVQDFIGMIGITHLDGSFYNVMGLPIHKVYKALQPFILK